MVRQRRVAIVIDLDWPLKYHHQIVAGVRRYARERPEWVCVLDLNAAERLTGRRDYDGIIARATTNLAAKAAAAGVPVVNVWLNSPARTLPSVFHDVAGGARLAVDHLVARGLRQFAHLGYTDDRLSDLQREAMREMLEPAGFHLATHDMPRGVGRPGREWASFQKSLDRWMSTWQRPIGVVVAHDTPARYLADRCLQRGLRVPDDVAIVGTFNEPIVCQQSEPTLSSVEFGLDAVGERAAALLDKLMAGRPAPAAPILVPPVEIAVRQSSDMLAVADTLVVEAVAFIATHEGRRLQVEDVARRFEVCRRTLDRRFHDALGRSVAREIARVRIERLKRHLAEGDAPLKTLASRLGFSNQQRLCETFRRLVGMTPGEFRRRHAAGQHAG